MLYVMFVCNGHQIYIGSYTDVSDYAKYRLHYHHLAESWARSVTQQEHGKVRIVLVDSNDMESDEELDALLGGTVPPWLLTDCELKTLAKNRYPDWYGQALRREAMIRHIRY